MKPSDSKYKGSRWNVKVEWYNGEISWEPLGIIAASDPVTCAIYAKRNSLLGLEVWRQFKRLARRQKKFVRMVHQTKLHSFQHRVVYKFGVQVPNNHEHAVELDNKNEDTKWSDAKKKELGQINE